MKISKTSQNDANNRTTVKAAIKAAPDKDPHKGWQ